MNSRSRFPSPPYPFSEGLHDFIDAHEDFLATLKLANPERFILLPHIKTSHPPCHSNLSEDEVIGMWYLDKNELLKPSKNGSLYKQDFIVNIGSLDKEFHSYCAHTFYKKYSQSDYIHPISDFFRRYGEDGKFYVRSSTQKPWMHNYQNEEALPDDGLRKLAIEIKLRILKELSL